jgi:hypothetical protein
MSTIDYMKMVGVLGRTLKLETIDMKFQDSSTDRLEVTLGGQSVPEKKFFLSLSSFSLELSFPAQYLQGRDLEKWLSSFEYELEQAYLKNVDIHITSDSSRHTLKVTM